MPKRTIDGALDVMEHLRNMGFGKECPKAELLKAISLLVGDKADTVHRYVDFMKLHGLAVPSATNGLVFTLNHDQAAKFLL